MKKLLLAICIFGTLIVPISSFAQQTSNDFEIIPKASSGGAVETAVEKI
jgi:hypothetical protein